MKGLENKEAKEARRYDSVMRAKSYTDVVYGGGKVQNAGQKLQETVESYRPEPSRYHIYFGEMHGHTDLSDAAPDIDTYFRVARDLAGLDFCAISDHDHGGIFSDELWGEKWDLTRRKVKEYAQQGKFLPILAYERDSYPWYDNLVIYFNEDIIPFLLGAVLNHALKVRSVVIGAGHGSVDVSIDDDDVVPLCVFFADAELPLYGLLRLVVGRIPRVNRCCFHRKPPKIFCFHYTA